MDIVRGNLDDISRPASVSRSRPGSRISSSLQTEKPKVFSTMCSLEVLTPDMSLEDYLTSHDGGETANVHNADSSTGDQSSDTLLTETSQQERNNESQAESNEMPPSTPNTDPRLEKAIQRMKALDEILLKKMAKEKEAKAQSKVIRKQLWEELQSVSKLSSARSNEENINTDKFLALTPVTGNNMDEECSIFEETLFPVFSTQIPLDECDDDLKALQGKSSEMESSNVSLSSERLQQRTKLKNSKDKKGVDFIQKNIELVKEAGSHVLLMDSEKLRLQQLLADIQDGCSDDEITTNVSLWLVPGEGYTPEPDELTQLAEIEAQLEKICSTRETSDCDLDVLDKHSKSDISLAKFRNSDFTPGEHVLRYTKELREQKIRLKEIDQHLEDMERSSSTSISITSLSSVLENEPA